MKASTCNKPCFDEELSIIIEKIVTNTKQEKNAKNFEIPSTNILL